MKTQELVNQLLTHSLAMLEVSDKEAAATTVLARAEVDAFIQKRQISPLDAVAKLGRLQHKTFNALRQAGLSTGAALQFTDRVGLPPLRTFTVEAPSETFSKTIPAPQADAASLPHQSEASRFISFVCRDGSEVSVAKNGVKGLDSDLFAGLSRTKSEHSPVNLARITRFQMLAIKEFAEADVLAANYSPMELTMVWRAAEYIGSGAMLDAVIKRSRARDLESLKLIVLPFENPTLAGLPTFYGQKPETDHFEYIISVDGSNRIKASLEDSLSKYGFQSISMTLRAGSYRNFLLSFDVPLASRHS